MLIQLGVFLNKMLTNVLEASELICSNNHNDPESL